MKEPKYTSGEWEIRGNKIFVKNTFVSIAEIHVHNNYEKITFKPKRDIESEANAKLIASAPELLEALIFSDMFPITTEQEEQKAIQIAKELGWKMDMPLENFAIQVRRNAINKATL